MPPLENVVAPSNVGRPNPLPTEISICTYNTQTLQGSNLRNLIEELDPSDNTLGSKQISWDIIGLCETHLIGTYTEDLHRNHKLFNSGPAQGRKQNGVGFLVHHKHIPSVIAFEGISERVAMLKLQGKYNNTVIIQCYLPTTTHPDEKVDEVYEQIQELINKTAQRDKLFICGDFNAKVGDLHHQYPDNIGLHNNIKRGHNNRGIKLANFCKQNDLCIANTQFKHRRKYTWVSPGDRFHNTVDYIIVRAKDKQCLKNAHTMSHPDISDHRIVRCKAKLTFTPTRKDTTKTRFNLEKLKDPAIQKQFSSTISEKLKSENPESSVQEQADNIQATLLETSADILGKPPAKRKPAWLSDTTIKSISQKHQTRKQHGHKSIEYNLHKTNVKKMIKADKEEQIDREHQELRDLPPDARYYEIIKRLQLSRKKKVKGWGIKAADKSVLCELGSILKRWKDFYADLYSTDNNVIIDLPENLDPIPVILLKELKKAIKMLKKNKAPGPDDLTVEMFEHGGETLHQRLLELLNCIIQHREVPTQLRLSEIVTLFKKGDLLDCANYRPITLLSHIYKLLMQIIYNRISQTVVCALPPSQAAYQPGRSTVEQIQSLQQIIEKCKEFNQSATICFIDFTKAFDSVDQNKLWEALQKHTNLSSSYINIIKLLYQDSKARVRTDIGTTEHIDILKGVKQGDLLSALLFCIALMVILANTFEGLDFGIRIGGENQQDKGYADDVGIITRTAAEMNTVLDKLHDCASVFGMKINVPKTKVMMIGTNADTAVYIKGQFLNIVDTFEYLGRVLSSNADDSHAVLSRIRKAWGAFEKKKSILTDKRISVTTKRKV